MLTRVGGVLGAGEMQRSLTLSHIYVQCLRSFSSNHHLGERCCTNQPVGNVSHFNGEMKLKFDVFIQYN